MFIHKVYVLVTGVSKPLPVGLETNQCRKTSVPLIGTSSKVYSSQCTGIPKGRRRSTCIGLGQLQGKQWASDRSNKLEKFSAGQHHANLLNAELLLECLKSVEQRPAPRWPRISLLKNASPAVSVIDRQCLA